MFKKPASVTLSSTHKISGGDRKKLRKSLQKAFPSASDEDLLAVLPNKDGELSLGKVQASRMQIYLLDEQPIFVDVSGKGDFFPTVFALWKAPNLLPTVYVKHPAVTTYVVGGADLMLPGVDDSGGLPAVEKGALCAIASPGNPAPLAVGEVAIASSDVGMAGGKGRFLKAVHHYRDCLWSLPGKEIVPNEGYYSNGVGPIGGAEQDLEGLAEEDTGEGEGGAETEAVTENLSAVSMSEADTLPREAPPAQGQEDVEGDDMDTLLRKAFMQALRTSLEDGMLPIQGGKLWSDHMLPCRPPGSHLDLKKSSFKKLSKFLKSMKEAGLIAAKEDKKTNETVISKVMRTQKDYLAFQPYDASAAVQEAPPPPAPLPGEPEPIAPLIIDEVFTTGSQKEVCIIFAAVVGPGYKTECYHKEEVFQIVNKYVESNNLLQADGQVLLDPQLCDALFKGVLKKGDTFPTHIDARQLGPTFLKRMLPQQRVKRGPREILKKGALPQISLQVKKRRDKKVTCVQGLEAFLIDTKQFAGHMQRRCACAASLEELEGSKNKNQCEVIIQGETMKQVVEELIEKYGVPKHFISNAESILKKK